MKRRSGMKSSKKRQRTEGEEKSEMEGKMRGDREKKTRKEDINPFHVYEYAICLQQSNIVIAAQCASSILPLCSFKQLCHLWAQQTNILHKGDGHYTDIGHTYTKEVQILKIQILQNFTKECKLRDGTILMWCWNPWKSLMWDVRMGRIQDSKNKNILEQLSKANCKNS